MQNSNKQAFTLVELIVVVTILAVLSTIGFVSYSGYLAGTRDTSRKASLKSIFDGLKLYSTNKTLPLPDETSTKIMDGSTQIATQGYAGSNVLETISYSTEGLDPKDGMYYSYYLTKNRKYFQLMALLEEEDNLQKEVNAINYSTRYPTVYGDKLGILTTSDNTPIQESTGSIDISNVGDTKLKSYLKDYEYVTGTGTTFKDLKKVADRGGRGYETDDNHYGYLWTDLDPIDCPDGFIPVSHDGIFTTKDFCVAKYEMTYIDADTPNSTSNGEIWNTVSYNSLKKTVSIAGKYPITEINQKQAIDECKKIGGHLITNNEWMTIVRGIEDVFINWSSGKIGEGNLFIGVSNNTNLGCNGKGGNTELRTYATKTGPGSDIICNSKRSHRLYNGQIIWDLAGNVFEHVNKSNSIDGSNYNDGHTSISGSSDGTGLDDDGIYDFGDMDKYGSHYYMGESKGMGNVYYADGNINNIFIRGGGARNETYAGLYTLNLYSNKDTANSFLGFRCVIY